MVRSIASMFPQAARSIKKFQQLREQSRKAKLLAEELLNQVQKARKNVGGRYQEYIDMFGDKPIDSGKLESVLSKLPPDLLDEIKSNPAILKQVVGQKEIGQFVMGPTSKQVTPQITRVKGDKIDYRVVPSRFDPNAGKYPNEVVTLKQYVESPEDIVALQTQGLPRKVTTVSPKTTYSVRPETKGVSKLSPGREAVAPTLKNAKAIRDVTRGDVSTTYWKPKMIDEPTKRIADAVYEDMGVIMREDNPDLANIMAHYAKARQAGSQLYPQLKTPQGITKLARFTVCLNPERITHRPKRLRY